MTAQGPGSGPTPKTVADRFAALAIRRGVSLSALRSASARDFALVLAAAARGFAPGHGYSERKVNDLLRAFLDTAGAMLATDYVELRRWLVDFRLLARDGYGHVYTAGTPPPELAAVLRELAGTDLAAVARDARDRESAARAARKARWQASQRESGG